MSREEEKFDEFLNQKLDGFQPEFKDTYWQRAQLLMQQQGYGNRNPWIFRGILLVFAVLLPVFWFVNTNLHGSAKEHTLNLIKLQAANLQQASDHANLINEASFKSNKQNALIAKKNNKLNRNAKRIENEVNQQTQLPTLVLNENTNQPETKIIIEQTSEVPVVKESHVDLAETKEEIINKPFTEDVITLAPRTIVAGEFKGLICATCKPVINGYHKDFDQRQFRSFWGAEAYLTYYNAKLFDPKSVQYGFGVSYYYFYNRKLGVAAGLHYIRLNQSLETRTYYKSDYDFGSSNQIQTYQTCRLDYLQVPFSFLYRSNNKNLFDAGVNLLWILQTLDKVETTKSGEINSQTRSYEKGFTESINPFDIQLCLGYTRMLPANFYMQVKASMGILDVSIDNAVNSNTTDRNKGFKLGIGYKIK